MFYAIALFNCCKRSKADFILRFTRREDRDKYVNENDRFTIPVDRILAQRFFPGAFSGHRKDIGIYQWVDKREFAQLNTAPPSEYYLTHGDENE